MIVISEEPRIVAESVEMQRLTRTTKTGRHSGKMVTFTMDDGHHITMALTSMLRQESFLDAVFEKTGLMPRKRSRPSWDIFLVRELLNKMTCKGVI